MAKDTKDETKNSKFESFVRDKSFVREESRRVGEIESGKKIENQEIHLIGSFIVIIS